MPDKKIITISADVLKEEIINNPELVIINVLEEPYFKDCHIKGSINIPIHSLIEKTASWEKDQPIVLYCASDSCTKSAKAYDILEDLGFVDLAIFKGGIVQWFKKGYETNGACNLDYLQED